MARQSSIYADSCTIDAMPGLVTRHASSSSVASSSDRQDSHSPPSSASPPPTTTFTPGRDKDSLTQRINDIFPRLLRQHSDLVCEQHGGGGCPQAQATPTSPSPACSNDFGITYLDEGTWNRVYTIRPCFGPDSKLILRVALPVFRSVSKTASEVATMEWVRKNTCIPVPRIIAYDPSPNNELGYEWCIMEKATGVEFTEASLKLEQKLNVARTLADWVDGLCRHSFDVIGSLSTAEDEARHMRFVTTSSSDQNASQQLEQDQNRGGDQKGDLSRHDRTRSGSGSDTSDSHVVMGPPVSQELLSGDWREDYPFHHGPFHTPLDFVLSLIQCRAAEADDPRQALRAEARELRSKIYKLDFEGALARGFLPLDAKQQLDAESDQERLRTDRHRELTEARQRLSEVESALYPAATEAAGALCAESRELKEKLEDLDLETEMAESDWPSTTQRKLDAETDEARTDRHRELAKARERMKEVQSALCPPAGESDVDLDTSRFRPFMLVDQAEACRKLEKIARAVFSGTSVREIPETEAREDGGNATRADIPAWLDDHKEMETSSGCSEEENRKEDEANTSSSSADSTPAPQFHSHANPDHNHDQTRITASRFVLHHWDISKHNLLVDATTGQPTSLLDWEQIYSTPLFAVSRYPRLMRHKYDKWQHMSHYSGPDDSDEDSDGDSEDVLEWKRQDQRARRDCYHRRRMREAFDERLHQLNSRWLLGTTSGVGDWEDEYESEEDELYPKETTKEETEEEETKEEEANRKAKEEARRTTRTSWPYIAMRVFGVAMQAYYCPGEVEELEKLAGEGGWL
ncbi:Uu.00g134210.m01.CDS01 [Anthostomella pinea]|uniref:Uu.00g134210.m01.CDS01 n=1 Tax=Anthostomella pinea TaxID=933095 RepID=A0AAI8VQ31_9PEZI|nr:Uu.00g134210.m01.CDS01 [Anthostomella pinea]